MSTIDRIPRVLETDDLAAEETATGFPLERTVKADAAAVVVLTVSSYTKSIVKPFEATEPLRYTGEVWSTEELFVARVIAENDGASLPATS